MKTNALMIMMMGSTFCFLSSMAGCASTGAEDVTDDGVQSEITGSAVFSNTPVAPQTGVFEGTFDAIPGTADMNGVTGLSNGPATAYSSLAVIVRFNSLGMIDARNGADYAAQSAIPYVAGTTYHFRLAIDANAHHFSAYVTPAGGKELAIGVGYAFRTEQALTSTLNNLAVISGIGSHQVLNFSWTPSSPINPIPAGRTIKWAPGLSARGGIPNRSALINVKSAPYNAKGDGVTDDSAAIQAALNAAAANQVVYLPAATYVIKSTLIMSKSNVSIRGDGPAATILNYTGSGIGIKATQYAPEWSAQVSVSSAATQGSSQVTLSSASGISVGDLVIISQTNPSYATLTGQDGLLSWAGAPGPSGGRTNDPNRGMAQVDRVVSISGNTLTLERPLSLTFPSANTPVISHLTPAYGIGIESLQIYRTGTGGTGGDASSIDLEGVAESWVKNVASINHPGTANYAHVFFQSSYACEVRESWFQGGGINGGGQDYGVYLANNNSDTLTEDNVFVGMRHSLIMAGDSSGNVYGYNYSVGNYQSDATDCLSQDIDLHGGEPYMNLFEGNVVADIYFDDVWGGNANNTAYRNWAIAYSSGTSLPTYCRTAVTLEANTNSANIVANVLGRPGDSSTTDSLFDPTAKNTLFYQGNFSFLSNSATWISGAVTLPPSLYYGSSAMPAKPLWWGTTLPWPAFGPDVATKNGQTPALLRFNAHVL